jgi:hypothetical protein
LKSHLFAIASRDEIWIRGVLVQQRVEQGEASFQGGEILASDRLDAAIRDKCDALVESHLHFARELDDFRVRIVGSVRRVEADAVRSDAEDLSISISKGRLSVVTTPDRMKECVELLRGIEKKRVLNGAPASAGLSPGKAGAPFPFLWRNGSAAILLHEAAGHAAEHGAPPLRWPPWITVRDVPRLQWDDAAESPKPADLIGGECPTSFRRQSFRDVPLRRMVEVVVEHRGAPFDEPQERVDIHLVEGGSYDPLTETVNLRVAAADLIRDGHAQRLPPFDIVRSRASIAAALAGANGDPIPYPGVVCSREGQELVVGSRAPVMLTIFND